MKRTLLALTAILAALALSSGVALAATIICQPGADCLGTKNADTLEGTAGQDHIYGRVGGDTLKGLGGFDVLYGQGGNDKLFGGSERDFLTGGPGKDSISGGGGDDWHFFGNGWGRDSLTEDGASANELLFRAPSNSVFVTDDLVIDLTPGPGPEVRNASATNTIEWEGSVIHGVSSGAGDDHITGNSLGNHLGGYTGADTVSGMGGNDEIVVLDGVPDDIVDCGENLVGDTDIDFVLHDPGDEIDPDCETTSTQP